MRITKMSCFLFLFSLMCFNVHAKKGDQVPGYIIDKNGEKIEGEIIIGSITDNEVKVTFIEDGEDKKITYKPKQLQGYGYEETQVDDLGLEFKSWVHYEQQKVTYPPKPFGPTLVFMQKEEAGAITLYCYYMEVRNNPKNPFKYQYYIKGKNGEIVAVEKEDFRKMAGKLFGDYTAMANKIGTKDFDYKNLDRMVRDYNFWIDNQHNRTEYRVALKQ